MAVVLSEKQFDLGCVLSIELIEFIDRLGVQYGIKRGIKDGYQVLGLSKQNSELFLLIWEIFQEEELWDDCGKFGVQFERVKFEMFKYFGGVQQVLEYMSL